MEGYCEAAVAEEGLICGGWGHKLWESAQERRSLVAAAAADGEFVQVRAEVGEVEAGH